MKILFLDDMVSRVPRLRKDEEVFYARTLEEFADWLKANGTPDCIAFDHDLSEAHYTASGGYMDPNRPPSGTDCARWAVENGFIPKIVIVHSWNRDGAQRIAQQFLVGDTPMAPCTTVRVSPFNPNRYFMHEVDKHWS